MIGFDFHNRTRVVFGAGSLERLGQLARELRFTRTLLVSDPGMVATGYVDRAVALLAAAGIQVFPFHAFGENPDTAMLATGRDHAAARHIDSIVALGGGSSLDCAKGINFLLTQGGTMRELRGFGRATKPMLPMLGVPTTAGTGSEAQCFAVISDAETHEKMACGDPQAAFRVALLDPELTVTVPASVTAISGYDAISHAVESYVTRARNPMSDLFAREAWRLLEGHYERVLAVPDDLAARAAMQLGAHYAGTAIELSMLGAAHACANPLTARYGVTHGVAISLMLPHVVRWNAAVVEERYAELASLSRTETAPSAQGLVNRLRTLAQAGGLPANLQTVGVPREDLPRMAQDTTTQMTGKHNPRPFDEAGAVEIYESAYGS
ncbi:MAG: iron-containing alcohol dehydrogenase [Vicinamibacterales bacterium]